LAISVPSPELFQRIIEGDEIALRDAFRSYGPTARELARRIIGPDQADDVVEEAFLLIWIEPERWASAALDVHVLRVVRDLALAVRRRGVTPALAATDLEPFPIAPNLNAPDVVHEIDHDKLQRLLLRMPNERGRMLEDAWFDESSSQDEELSEAMDQLVEGIYSGRLTSPTQ